jgi:hypothetical protein
MKATIFWLCIVGFVMTVSGLALKNGEDLLGRFILATGIWIMVCGLLLLLGSQVLAMDGDNHGNHGDLKQWFGDLHSDKGPCCADADGFVIEDSDWESKDGHYRVRLPFEKDMDGHPVLIVKRPTGPDTEWKWVDVPNESVVRAPNLYGKTVVWPIGGDSTTIRCFMPGQMG